MTSWHGLFKLIYILYNIVVGNSNAAAYKYLNEFLKRPYVYVYAQRWKQSKCCEMLSNR